MHKINFKHSGRSIELTVDENESHIAIEVLKLLGYEVETTIERLYSRITRVYKMRQIPDVNELNDNGRIRREK